MQYIIHATDKKPDEEKGIVTVKTDNGIKKLYLKHWSTRAENNLLGVSAKILGGFEQEENLDVISIAMSRDDLVFLDTMLRRVLVTTQSKEERLRLAEITKKMLYAYAPNTRPTAGVRHPNL